MSSSTSQIPKVWTPIPQKPLNILYLSIYEKLLQFANDSSQIQYTFDSHTNGMVLTNEERRRIHKMAKKFHFVSWSEGEKNSRVTIVSKDQSLRETKMYTGCKVVDQTFQHFPYKEPICLFHFTDNKWKKWQKRVLSQPQKMEQSKSQASNSASSSSPRSVLFKVFTLNVLFDVVDSEKTYTHKRIPLILNELRRHKPDIIALQEMTTNLLQHVLDDAWIRKRYLVTDASGSTIKPYGVLILVKKKMMPSGAHLYRFSTYKQCCFVSFDLKTPRTSDDEPERVEKFLFQAVHLTAGREKHETRCMQNRLLQEESQQFPHCIQAGDFNFSDRRDAHSDMCISREYQDAWTEHHDITSSPGHTFDPQRNHFAKMVSRSKDSRRLDRIFYKSTGKALQLKCRSVEIVANESIEFVDTSRLAFKGGARINLFPSDHYGLLAEFELKKR